MRDETRARWRLRRWAASMGRGAAVLFVALLLAPVAQAQLRLLHTQTQSLASFLSIPDALLYGFEIDADSTLSGAPWWILVFNVTPANAPTSGSVTPDKCYPMAAGENRFTAAWPNPLTFGNGVTIEVSTTGCFTLTQSAHSFIGVDFQ